MFFSIRSKLVSLLQPWLQSEPDLEFKLGFLHSHGIANNLHFDVSALDRLIDDSIPLNFSEVRVETLNIQFSPWSSCALTIEVTGLYVKLNAREPVVYGESRTNCEENEKKVVLSVIENQIWPESETFNKFFTGSTHHVTTANSMELILRLAFIFVCGVVYPENISFVKGACSLEPT